MYDTTVMIVVMLFLNLQITLLFKYFNMFRAMNSMSSQTLMYTINKDMLIEFIWKTLMKKYSDKIIDVLPI